MKLKRNRRVGDVQQGGAVRREHRRTADTVRAGEARPAHPGAGRGQRGPPEHDRGQSAAGAQRGAALFAAGREHGRPVSGDSCFHSLIIS